MLRRHFNNDVMTVSDHSGYERSKIVIESQLVLNTKNRKAAFDWHMSLGVSAGVSSGR
jgi:hypothetical protein